jgi:UDP-3-O-[3-hydroxymyristoyl] glucosamine N-acyltransferase
MKKKDSQVPLSLITSTLNVNALNCDNPASLKISSLCPFDELKNGCITFTKEHRIQKIIEKLEGQQNIPSPAAIIISERHHGDASEIPLPVLLSPEPLLSIVKLLPLFYEEPLRIAEVSEKADVHSSAVLGKDVYIGAFSVIGAYTNIGDRTVIHPHVTLYDHVTIGADCIIHAGAIIRENCVIHDHTVIQNGAIIGADGFGYIFDPHAQKLLKIPQVGIVDIAKSSEVGANSCIDRATLGTTKIGNGTKIDNLVQIGHNTKIGNNTIICGKVGIAGSCSIGDNVVLGGDVGIKDHVTIESNIRVGAKAGVIGDLKEKGDYAGFPAVKAHTWRKLTKKLLTLVDAHDKEV